MSPCWIPLCLNVVSAIAAIAAAVLWWKSARVKTPQRFSIMVKHLHGLPDTTIMGDSTVGAPIGEAESPELQQLAAALQAQSKLSSHAAKCAAVAALAQGVAFVIHVPC
jgi:Flp pilus assembly protein TadB